jgi:hypothetical protein
MGLLRRRRSQPHPHHSSHSSFAEGDLTRAAASAVPALMSGCRAQ